MTEAATKRYRALFISDVHLGTRGCQADKLLDFLRHHEADTIYLVGDIVDGWALRSSWYWPQAHNDVVQKLLRQARKGARMIYVPGNHDEFLRGYYGTHFGGIEVVENIVHEGADGRRYLVVHGDIFDLVVTQARWLALLGDKAYDFALTANRVFNGFRRVLGAPYWSLSKWAKLKVKNAVNYIGAFEKALATEAHRHQADGVICGHIHTPGHPRRFRHPLHQLRRLGGKLHGGGRAPRRHVRDHHLDQDRARPRAGRRGRTAASRVNNLTFSSVRPAQAGTQCDDADFVWPLGSRLRGNERRKV